MEERKVTVPFRTVKKADPLSERQDQDRAKGPREGLVIQKIEKVYEDGKLVYSKMVDKKVKTKQVNQVVAYGTKKEPEGRRAVRQRG
ncbi:G5 domain-containing protein [Paenibacillus thiaminolyticus]|uniref:G5 domain-containing protein n=1 Tax=Paenibacillus thiaminolyticus TaxID=49283 RepID=UPI0021C4367B|nr:G5 domain-containing protein [Paenibacillus thiaminolyticus]CAH8720978.1 G5 domain-containing protein [Paenibacillus thiaminolyticus]